MTRWVEESSKLEVEPCRVSSGLLCVSAFTTQMVAQAKLGVHADPKVKAALVQVGWPVSEIEQVVPAERQAMDSFFVLCEHMCRQVHFSRPQAPCRKLLCQHDNKQRHSKHAAPSR
eukprot:5064760-Amphidinium_carterae.2